MIRKGNVSSHGTVIQLFHVSRIVVDLKSRIIIILRRAETSEPRGDEGMRPSVIIVDRPLHLHEVKSRIPFYV